MKIALNEYEKLMSQAADKLAATLDDNARLRALNAELIAAFRDVLQWAGKDKGRLKRQWKMTALELISMQGQSLNRSYEAIAHAEDSNARAR